MSSDWRLTNQMNYLKEVELKKVDFYDVLMHDHEHCEFCFAKFGNDVGLLKKGYCTLDHYHWICAECFKDFQELFDWQVIDTIF